MCLLEFETTITLLEFPNIVGALKHSPTLKPVFQLLTLNCKIFAVLRNEALRREVYA
jgi:hypothetical protein